MIRLLIASTLLVAALGAPGHKSLRPLLDGRIVGGEAVSIDQVNYQVSLLYYGSHICGGSIISSTYVLTAAHCVEGASASAVQIRAGSSIRNSGGVVIQVASLGMHPQYNPYLIDYDVAVLALASPLSFSNDIGTIGLPYENQFFEEGTFTYVTGWGTLTEGGSLPSALQGVYVPLVSLTNCRSAYGSSSVTDRMLCAGFPTGGRDACQGDSGGPLVIEGLVVGIVSWGAGCARPNYPGVYSSVPSLRQFIEDVTNL